MAVKCDLSEFFDDTNNVNQLELLCNFVCDGLKSRLRACKPLDLRVNMDEETAADKLIDDSDVLASIGKSVNEGLQLILSVTGKSFKHVRPPILVLLKINTLSVVFNVNAYACIQDGSFFNIKKRTICLSKTRRILLITWKRMMMMIHLSTTMLF